VAADAGDTERSERTKALTIEIAVMRRKVVKNLISSSYSGQPQDAESALGD
jgi:hypothetical protein